MADTVVTTETATPEAVKNDVTPTSAPAVDNASKEADLQKQLDQARMREQQLLNKEAERDKAEDEAKRKQLEEKEQFKDLYEKEKAERERITNEQLETERKQAVSKAQNEIFAGFPSDVTEVAATAGLSLTDDSDEAKDALKTKLESIASKVNSKQTVTGNNPNPNTQTTGTDRTKLLQRMRFNDNDLASAAKVEAISTLPALDVMREQAGYKVNK